jgi:hypothetical protein
MYPSIIPLLFTEYRHVVGGGTCSCDGQAINVINPPTDYTLSAHNCMIYCCVDSHARNWAFEELTIDSGPCLSGWEERAKRSAALANEVAKNLAEVKTQ